MHSGQSQAQCGSITRKPNGRWYATISVRGPYGSARVALGGFATRADADLAVAKATVERAANAFVPKARTRLSTYLSDVWLPSIVDEVRDTTWANYAALLRAYVLPYPIAALPLSALNEIEFKRHYAMLRRRGGRAHTGFSPKTVLHVHAMLRRALDDAVASQISAQNPTPRRRPLVDPTEARWLLPAQLTEVLTYARFHDPDTYPAFRLAAVAGLRRGEIAGLRWSAVDLRAASLSLRETRAVAAGRVVEGPPKTRGSTALIRIDDESCSALTHLRNRRATLVGGDVPIEEHVFVHHTGRPVYPDLFTKRLHRIIDEMNEDRADPLPLVSLHGLRHSYASALVAAGEHISVIQAAMRHSSIRVTADTYAHLIDNAVGEVNQRLGRQLGAG